MSNLSIERDSYLKIFFNLSQCDDNKLWDSFLFLINLIDDCIQLGINLTTGIFRMMISISL